MHGCTSNGRFSPVQDTHISIFLILVLKATVPNPTLGSLVLFCFGFFLNTFSPLLSPRAWATAQGQGLLSSGVLGWKHFMDQGWPKLVLEEVVTVTEGCRRRAGPEHTEQWFTSRKDLRRRLTTSLPLGRRPRACRQLIMLYFLTSLPPTWTGKSFLSNTKIH